MDKIVKIWSIIWPILRSIFNTLGFWEYIEAFLLYIVLYLVLKSLVKSFLPKKQRGSFIGEGIFLFIDIALVISPLVGIYFWFKTRVPLLVQLISYILGLTELIDLANILLRVFLVCMIAFGIARWLIYTVSLLLQRVAIDFPLGEVFVVVIRMVEGVFFMLTVLWLPFFGLSLFKQVDPYPVLIYSPIIMPEEANERVWEYIEEGVYNAQQNGVDCDPYLLYSLKEYETGSHMCSLTHQYLPRPNSCASYAGALGMWQFIPETFTRNANRYNVEGNLWEPQIASEVACYFINDEVKMSLAQPRDVFINQFAINGLVWNRDPDGAGRVYDRAHALRKSSISTFVRPNIEYQGYIWPAPNDSFLWYEWGVTMWYGTPHNGIDIAMEGLPAFSVYALSDGKASYNDGGDCNAGVITLKTNSGETFLYVHMELDLNKIYIPTNGTFVSVQKGEILGWILDGDTTCSRGNHLHLMRADGSYISALEFEK